MSLTPKQKTNLIHMVFHNNRMHGDMDDRTMLALEELGLIKYRGNFIWRLTADGMIRADKLAKKVKTNHFNIAEQVRVLGADSLLPPAKKKKLDDEQAIRLALVRRLERSACSTRVPMDILTLIASTLERY